MHNLTNAGFKAGSKALFAFAKNFVRKNFFSLSIDEINDIISVSMIKLLKSKLFKNNENNSGLPYAYFSRILKGEAHRILNKKRSRNVRETKYYNMKLNRTGLDPFEITADMEMKKKSRILIAEFIKEYKNLNDMIYLLLKYRDWMKYSEMIIMTGTPGSTIHSGIENVINKLRDLLLKKNITDPSDIRIFIHILFKEQMKRSDDFFVEKISA